MKLFSVYTTEKSGRKRLRLNSVSTVILFVLFTLMVFAFQIYIQPNSFLFSIKNIISQPLLFLLDLLPIFFVSGIIYFACCNLFYSFAGTQAIFYLCSYVNILKVEGREDTFVPADFSLIREGLASASDYKLDMHVPLLCIIFIMVAIFVVIGIFVKTPKIHLAIRLSGIAVIIGIFVALVNLVYVSFDLYNSFSVTNRSNVPMVYDELGFNYCFLYNFGAAKAEKPKGYSDSEVKAWIDDFPYSCDDAESPNIIFLMCEAFSDISDESVFSYVGEDDPLYYYKKVANEDRAYSGHIIVSNYGAGTANTEFDIMTGFRTNLVGKSVGSSLRVIRKNTQSIASKLSNDGYTTFFMHPGQSWFYNRNSAYQYLGMDELLFEQDFTYTDKKGWYVSDSSFLEEIKYQCENRIDGNPFFTYGVTYQNHQRYPYSKYVYSVPPLATDLSLSPEAVEQLSVYLEGVRDSSKMLYDLTQYLDSLDEPFLLVFYGDHRPNLSGADVELGLGFNEANNPYDTVNTYSTPFVIWANSAYVTPDEFDNKISELDLPNSGIINSSYLAPIVFEFTTRDREDPFFSFLNEMRRVVPVSCEKEGVYMLFDGSYVDNLSKTEQAYFDRFSKWMYFYLK